MAVPIIGDIIQSTVGKTIDRLYDRYLPQSLNDKDKAELKAEAARLAVEEYRAAVAQIQGARELAGKESEGAPGWTKVLTVTHRPVWSFFTLAVFAWTILSPYFGFTQSPLTAVHKDIMQTVIIFYFGGRSIEKATEAVWGK